MGNELPLTAQWQIQGTECAPANPESATILPFHPAMLGFGVHVISERMF